MSTFEPMKEHFLEYKAEPLQLWAVVIYDVFSSAHGEEQFDGDSRFGQQLLTHSRFIHQGIKESRMQTAARWDH